MAETTVKGKGTSGIDGYQVVKSLLDGVMDGEITGESLLPTSFDSTCNGSDQVLLAVDADKQLKVKMITVQVTADLTGSITVKCGSHSFPKIVNPANRGQYMAVSAKTDFYLGAAGADLIVNGTSGAVVTVGVHYILEDV